MRIFYRLKFLKNPKSASRDAQIGKATEKATKRQKAGTLGPRGPKGKPYEKTPNNLC